MFTEETMRNRLQAVAAEIAVIDESLKPLHEEYNALRTGPVRDETRMREVVAEIAEGEVPLRELRKEESLLARALGGRSLSAA